VPSFLSNHVLKGRARKRGLCAFGGFPYGSFYKTLRVCFFNLGFRHQPRGGLTLPPFALLAPPDRASRPCHPSETAAGGLPP
jgi:hypothetical protein